MQTYKSMFNKNRSKKFSSLTRPAILQRLGLLFTTLVSIALAFQSIRASELLAPNAKIRDYLGSAVSVSGENGLAGAPRGNEDGERGSAYFYRMIGSAGSTEISDLELLPIDLYPIVAQNSFGTAVSLSGDIALVGRYGGNVEGVGYFGDGYIFRNLATARGTIDADAELTIPDAGVDDGFAATVSLSGSVGLIGSYGDKAAYLYRNLDTATGTIYPDVTLSLLKTKSGEFGASVSLAGNTALVGDPSSGPPGNPNRAGEVYVFRNLDAAIATKNEDAKLIPLDGIINDRFGTSVSLYRSMGLVGSLDHQSKGSAYLFRDLDTAVGTIVQNAKLIASDGADRDFFGNSLSLSGNVGLIGAFSQNINNKARQGSAYLFCHLDTATSTITQNVKITASDGMEDDNFGFSVSVDGDNFMIGARYADGAAAASGKAYSGSVASLTTLDLGNTSRLIAGLSFISQNDWIVGENRNGNTVTLGRSNIAKVLTGGTAVYIGKNAGSGHNKLIIAGTLQCTYVYIGSTSGNANNVLQADSTAKITATALRLAKGNRLLVAGTPATAKTFLQTTPLQIFVSGAWKTVTAANFRTLVTITQSGGYTVVIPAGE